MTLVVFLVRRIVRLVLSLLVVSMIAFGLLQLAPGSFAGIQAVGAGSTGLAAATSVQSTETLQRDYGSHVPVWRQYWTWLHGALTGDLGPSYKYPSQSVQTIISHALPISATLAVLAVALALLIAVPLGVLAAVRRNTIWDYAAMFTTTAGHAIPNYLAAIGFVLLFSVGLHVLPTGGWDGPANVVMPVLALALAPAGVLARYVRSSVLEVLHEEYVVAARAKGGRPSVILLRHVLRNSLIPLITIAGPMLAGLMSGTIFIETIFGIPGMGRYFTQAAQSRDMPLLMGATITFAFILMLTNVLVDLGYAALDPRIKIGLGLDRRVTRRSGSAWRSLLRRGPVEGSEELATRTAASLPVDAVL